MKKVNETGDISKITEIRAFFLTYSLSSFRCFKFYLVFALDLYIEWDLFN